ncbi:alpha/beta hydrolase [Streptomyces sp. 8L]|uniref:alpha/beta hydrolase n=1 Tax=Streptomyces sp. 8L TaxID=2877242 RepID=UPI001CD39511|nr:alpha/beta hydrolase [Streptomyces sp. 8L]MCA1220840.1 alpha/beta hydrolase [Streptomyces sp. 8L]
MTATSSPVRADWRPPAAVAPRGTLLVLPGRGEHPLLYERFGRRLAFDGYVVHAVPVRPEDAPAEVLAAVRAAAGRDPVAPVVLVGSDTGALQALHTAAERDPAPRVDGVVAAGAAPTGSGVAQGPEGDSDAAWEAELAARTSCPTHRARLSGDEAFVRGGLADPVPEALRAEAAPAVPVLLLHGDADPVTPVEEARLRARRLPRAELGVVRGGVHDALNDITHRTTAAAVVLWLERLRADGVERPIVTLTGA